MRELLCSLPEQINKKDGGKEERAEIKQPEKRSCEKRGGRGRGKEGRKKQLALVASRQGSPLGADQRKKVTQGGNQELGGRGGGRGGRGGEALEGEKICLYIILEGERATEGIWTH